MNNNNKKIILGVDDGYAETKIYGIVGGREIKLSIPSRAALGGSNKIMVGAGDSGIREYSTGDQTYSAVAVDNAEDTAFDSYPTSALNRVIVAHALCAVGFDASDSLSICTGLPLRKYYRAGAPNYALIAAKQKNLMIPVTDTDGVPVIDIDRHEVLSEAVAGWLDYVLQPDNDSGYKPHPDRLIETVAVVDVGGRTTDIAVIREFELDSARSSTINCGMLDVHHALADTLENELGTRPTDGQIRAAVRTQHMLWQGQTRSVSAQLAAARATAAQRMRNEIRRRLGDAVDVNRVLFVGGGALAFAEHLTDMFPHQTLAREPAFANARGMFKFLSGLK